MSDTEVRDSESFPLPHILKPGEVIESQANANGAVIAVTEQRLVVVESDGTVLDIPYGELRRIQFDIERDRDATVVIVPEHISNWPRVVSIPVPALREAAIALARIGERINQYEPDKTG